MPERNLYRSKRGEKVHDASCPHAKKGYLWKYADGLTDEELLARVDFYPWLTWCHLCRPDLVIQHG